MKVIVCIPTYNERDSIAETIRGICDLNREKLRSEEHTSELQSQSNLVCRLLLEKKKKKDDLQLQLRQHAESPSHKVHDERRLVYATLFHVERHPSVGLTHCLLVTASDVYPASDI